MKSSQKCGWQIELKVVKLALDLLVYLQIVSDLHHSYPATIPTGTLIRIPKIGLFDRLLNYPANSHSHEFTPHLARCHDSSLS